MGIISLPKIELPVKKPNSPLGRFVCWNCKNGNITLFRLRDNKGKKTANYVCINCQHLGSPTNNESSFIEFKYKS